MSFWQRLFGGRSRAWEAPFWAPFAREEEFDDFIECVATALEREGHDVDLEMIRSGSIIADGTGGRHEWHLATLAEQCSATGRADWDALVRGSFPTALRAGMQRPARSLKPAKDASLPWLRLQLFSKGYLELVDRDAICMRPLGEALYAVLVRDIAGAAEATVGRAEARAWRRTEDDLFALAQRNAVDADLDRIVTQVVTTDDGRFEIMVSNGFYLGACVLALVERLQSGPGMLVCFLSWHHAVLHSIGPGTSRATLDSMHHVVDTLAAGVDVTRSEWLGTELFLAQNGRLEQIAFSTDAGSPQVVGPAALVELLDKAPPAP